MIQINEALKANIVAAGKTPEAIARIENHLNGSGGMAYDCGDKVMTTQLYVYYTRNGHVGLDNNKYCKVYSIPANVQTEISDINELMKHLIINDVSLCGFDTAVGMEMQCKPTNMEQELHEHILYLRWHYRVECPNDEVYNHLLMMHGLTTNVISKDLHISNMAIY